MVVSCQYSAHKLALNRYFPSAFNYVIDHPCKMAHILHFELERGTYVFILRRRRGGQKMCPTLFRIGKKKGLQQKCCHFYASQGGEGGDD